MIGHSRAVAKTAVGQLTLDPINVNVTTSLNGLQGLQNLASINSVDVNGGTKDGITLGIECTLFHFVVKAASIIWFNL
jgi:hypothetical protein